MQARAHLRLVSEPEITPPPEDIAAERALIGSLLAGDSRLEDVEDLVSREMFAVKIHEVTWGAMTIQRDSGDSYGFVETRSLLVESGHTSDEIRDMEAAYRDHSWTIGGKAARGYAEAVRTAWNARRVRTVATELTAYAEHRRGELDAAMEKASESLRGIAADMAPTSGVVTMSDAAMLWAKQLSSAPSETMTLGLRELDEVTGGLRRRQTTIIGARTSVGKSALSLQAAIATAQAGYGVLYLSLEMTPEVMCQRAVAHLAQVDGRRLQSRCLDARELGRVQNALKLLKGEMPIQLNASQSMSLAEILLLVTSAHRSMRRNGQSLGLVVVDHIGLVRPAGELLKASREQQVATVSRSLRGIAERFDCHVIGCCQVNRGSEKRQGAEKRPQLHDLRDSGSVEQDADMVVLIHRGRDNSGLFLSEPAEIVVAKNRVNGQLGMVKAEFDAPMQTFGEVKQCW